MGRCDCPPRQCWEWHVVSPIKRKARKVSHRKRDDDTDDPYSIRLLCPAHDDTQPSLSLSLEDDRIKWQCFACGKDATARVRRALIREYDISEECLPLPTKERQDILDRVRQILTADSADHAGIRLRALAAVEGYADLPRGGVLERLAALARVNRVTAYRARKSPLPPGGQTANPRSYTPAEKPVKPRRSGAHRKVA